MCEKMEKKSLPLSLLFVTVILAFCSIVYELLLAQTLTEIFGGSVLRYALTIGLYLFSMGIGVSAYGFARKRLPLNLISLEIILSLVGALSVFILFNLAFVSIEQYTFSLISGHALICVIGFLSGMEIPFLVDLDPKKRFSLILGVDFIGTLIGALAFPLLFYPHLSLFSVGVFIALLNFITAVYLALKQPNTSFFSWLALALTSVFFIVFVRHHSDVGYHLLTQYEIKRHSINWRHSDASWQEIAEKTKVLDFFRTPYQRVLIIEDKSEQVVPGRTLYLDKSTQLQDWWIDSYHETMSLLTLLFQKKEALNIALLGGGDGILVQHLLRDPRVASIQVIDIDKEFMDFMAASPHYQAFHQHSLTDPKVTVFPRDAYAFLRKNSFKNADEKMQYDAIILDLPGLKDGDKLMHLYSEEMFKFMQQSLAPDGMMVTWHYLAEAHKKVLEQTLWAAGYENIHYSCSRVSKAQQHRMSDLDACIERFFVANLNPEPPEANPQYLSDYQSNWMDRHFEKHEWKPLEDLGIRAHSIFRPNYDLIPVRKK